jgi:hypothetical protein
LDIYRLLLRKRPFLMPTGFIFSRLHLSFLAIWDYTVIDHDRTNANVSRLNSTARVYYL